MKLELRMPLPADLERGISEGEMETTTGHEYSTLLIWGAILDEFKEHEARSEEATVEVRHIKTDMLGRFCIEALIAIDAAVKDMRKKGQEVSPALAAVAEIIAVMLTAASRGSP
jgi:hypothetical protein